MAGTNKPVAVLGIGAIGHGKAAALEQQAREPKPGGAAR
jgi:hypothetical protein